VLRFIHRENPLGLRLLKPFKAHSAVCLLKRQLQGISDFFSKLKNLA
jgi:hypothetical protein